MILKLGTRRSKLALWQTHHIKTALEAAWSDLQCEVVEFVTKGDKVLDKPLPEIGGKGLFTQELEAALLDGRVDIAVHSLKDLPVENPDGITLGAIGKRANPADVLIGSTLADLAQGAIVGTSSLRRGAQLKAQRPDLEIQSIRGNVPTRIRKCEVGQYAAIVLAAAGVERLDMHAHIAEYLDLNTMLPAPGQAAIGIQCRAGDAATLNALSVIDHAATRACVTAERVFLHALGGGCAVPVAAYATQHDDQLTLVGAVYHPDGTQSLTATATGTDAIALGNAVAQDVLAQGAGEILAEVKGNA